MYKIGKFCLQSRAAARPHPFLFIALLFLLPLGSFAQDLPAEDAALMQKIRQAILNDSRLPIDGISLVVVDGAIRLKGGVQSLAQKRWVEELIYQIPETKVVDNQLTVVVPNLSDEELAENCKSKLLRTQNALLDFSNIEVESKGGKVALKGTVEHVGAKLQAEEIVAVVPGVRHIDNKLKIRDDVHDSDSKIERAVIVALREKIQMSRDFYIDVSVVRGIVTLSGRVSSARDHNLAIRTTLFIPGTAEIVDKIELLPR